MKALMRIWWIWFGSWRVIYPDGLVSIKMTYRGASDYASIFSGKAVPDYEVPDERIEVAYEGRFPYTRLREERREA